MRQVADASINVPSLTMIRSPLIFAGYTFASDKGCFTCSHVMEGTPVLFFAHEEDGDLQFLCGASGHDSEKECRWLHTAHVLEWYPDLLTLPIVEMGFEAERTAVGAPWTVTLIPSHERVRFPPISSRSPPSARMPGADGLQTPQYRTVRKRRGAGLRNGNTEAAQPSR